MTTYSALRFGRLHVHPYNLYFPVNEHASGRFYIAHHRRQHQHELKAVTKRKGMFRKSKEAVFTDIFRSSLYR